MEEVIRTAVLEGIDEKLITDALKLLVFTEEKAEYTNKEGVKVEETTATLDRDSIEPVLKFLHEAKVNLEAVERVRLAIQLTILHELDCESFEDLEKFVLLLGVYGLEKKVMDGLLALAKASEGDELPSYNPLPGFMEWCIKHPEHSTFTDPVMSFILSSLSCEDEEGDEE